MKTSITWYQNRGILSKAFFKDREAACGASSGQPSQSYTIVISPSMKEIQFNHFSCKETRRGCADFVKQLCNSQTGQGSSIISARNRRVLAKHSPNRKNPRHHRGRPSTLSSAPSGVCPCRPACPRSFLPSFRRRPSPRARAAACNG